VMVETTKVEKATDTAASRAGPRRRSVLAATGGVVVGVAAGAAVAGDVYAARRGVFASGGGPAYEPWRDWDRGALRLRPVRAGILAANAHNAQAWRFAVSPGEIGAYADTGRGLGTVDVYRREMHLSLGCAVENIVLAARAAGYAPTVTLSVAEAGGPVARVGLTAGPRAVSELYRAIPHRHTDRGPYQPDRRLPAEVPVGMDALVDDPDVRLLWLLDATHRNEFSALTTAATEAFIADRRQSTDDYAWYRGTWSQLQRHRDGVTVDASGLSPVLRSLGKLVPASRTSNDSYWLAGTRDRQLPTAAGFAIMLTRTPDRGTTGNVPRWLAAGRIYQRLHLWATSRGLAMQPLNQSVERAERERSTTGPAQISTALAAVVADPNWEPVMPFRIGYPTTDAGASPRRDVQDVLVTAP
jgi:hypothetical protein